MLVTGALLAALWLMAPAAEAAPTNDNFANAIALPASLADIFENNAGATKEPGEPDHAGDPGGHSVWFTWTPLASGTVEFSTCAFSDIDTLLAVYTGSKVDSLTAVGSSDDGTGGCRSTDSSVRFDAVAGTTYSIAADGKGGTEGEFTVRLRGRPANDNFAQAEVLSPTLPSTVNFGNNQFATKEPGEPDHAGDPGGHSVWYSWTPSSSGRVDIDACRSEFDTLLAVYTGSSVAGLTPVASNDDRSQTDCKHSTSDVGFDAVAGTTYRIALDGKAGAGGRIVLQLSGTPANDNFANARTVSPSPPGSVEGTTLLATREAGEPDHAAAGGSHSVWYSWTPSVSQPIRIFTNCAFATSLDPAIAVYTGSAVGSLTEVASDDDGGVSSCLPTDAEVAFQAIAGTTYRIAIDGFAEGAGRFRLEFADGPQNDDFAAAQTLAPTMTAFAGGTNILATKQAGEPDHAGDPGGHSVWYSWTPSSSGRVRVTTCFGAGALEPLLAVYTGSSVGSLTQIAASGGPTDPECPVRASEARFDAVAGTTYRIAVDGRGGSVGSFSVALQGQPVNDDFSQTQALAPELPAFVIGDTRLATKQPGEPNHAGDPGGHSVWYSWTPQASGTVTMSACSDRGEFEPLLAVYTGSSVGGLTAVAANAGNDSRCEASGSSVEFDAVAGTPYRIAVDGMAGEEGRFDMTFRPIKAAANDDFADAEVLNSALSTFSSGTNILATKQPGETNHAGDPGGHSVWYSWTPQVSGTVRISTCSSEGTIDPLLAVYTGTSVGSLTQVAANDDSLDSECQAADSRVEFAAAVGTTYKIAVDGKGGSQGDFLLSLAGPPKNDRFAKAEPFPQNVPTALFGTTRSATKEPGEPDHAGDPGGHSVWYSWTSEEDGPVDFTTCSESAGFDPLLAVYTGPSVTSLTPVASNDDAASGRCAPGDSEVTFDAHAGTIYELAVDGKNGRTGAFELEVDGRRANDNFAAAQPVSGNVPAEVSGTNRFATKQPGEPNHAGDPGGSSLWFKWTAPLSERVSLDTCESNFDTLLAVYTGSSLASLNPVAGSDDGGGSCGSRSRLSFDAVAGTNYKIAVDGKGVDDQGRVLLRFRARPANDDFDHARALPGSLPQFTAGPTQLATKQPGEPNHAGDPGGHSVWYSWTPIRSGQVDAETCESDFDTLLAVYTGPTVDNLTPVAGNDDGGEGCASGSRVSFDAVAGTTYRIAVDGAGGDEGQVFLFVEPAGRRHRTLAVAKPGGGSGTVTSSPAGIDCGPSCSHEFEVGAPITLTTTPAPGSTFVGWSGGGCSGSGACHLTLETNTTLTARFEPLPGGGGGQGGGPVAAPQPPPAPPKPVRCKRGFRKVRSHGRTRCIRKKHRHRRS
jgi:hypothetical protein